MGAKEPIANSFLKLVESAGDALRANPSLFNVGALLRLYGTTLKLTAKAEQVRRLVEEGQTKEGSLQLRRADLELFEDFNDVLSEFDQALNELDVALLEIYHPGLLDQILSIIGRDIDAVKIFNQTIAPKYGLDIHHLPPNLAHFLRSYGTRYVSLHRLSESIPKDTYDGLADEADTLRLGRTHYPNHIGRRPEMEYWSVHGPPDSTVSVSRDQAAAILALIDGLNEVRNSVGRLVRENWSLAQITDIGKPDVSLGVHMGDTYSNISGSTIVNRSLVQNSFNRVQEQLGDEVAQALRQLADVIERSGNTEAAENFNAFNEELQKDQPKKPVLRSLWQGILSTLPAIGQMTDIVAKISAIL